MRTVILILQIIETEPDLKTRELKSTIIQNQSIQVNEVFASNQKTIEYFVGLADKFRSAIL